MMVSVTMMVVVLVTVTVLVEVPAKVWFRSYVYRLREIYYDTSSC